MDDSPTSMSYPRSRLTIASRAARIAPPIDGPTLGPDLDLLARDCAITLSLGMAGKLCMTTAQTAPRQRRTESLCSRRDLAQNVIDDLGEDGSRVRDGSDLPKLAKAKKIHKLATLFHIPHRSLIFLLLNRCRKRQALKSERLTFVF